MTRAKLIVQLPASVSRSRPTYTSELVPTTAYRSQPAPAEALAEAFLEKFGGDSIAEIERNFQGYLASITG
jgi:chorismate synthase